MRATSNNYIAFYPVFLIYQLSDYSKNDARVFGFVSERLLDIWLDTNRCPHRDLPYAFMERQNWIKKAEAFR